MLESPDKKRKGLLVYSVIVAISILAGALATEAVLSYGSKPRAILPFYNRLYPYVMFRPMESYSYETEETYEMSHHKSRVFVYTNEDGFRIPSLQYKLPRQKPAGQLRIAFLGGSLVQLASTFDTTLPGALKILLQRRYPGRDIEVINAGVQSCVSRQSIAQLMFSVVDYHPDIVILYDGGNDIGLPLTYESRPNFPYNFQTMEEAWDLYRQERREPLWRVALERSQLFRIIRARLEPGKRKLAPTADEPFAGTNALSADRIVTDKELRVNQIIAYLSNWRKLVELAGSYHYKPVCILTPTPGLDVDFALPRMITSFHLDEATARIWIRAFDLLYDEADRQIADLRAAYRDAVFMNLARALKPPEKYFWDLAHVYDEANMTLAELIYGQIRPVIEGSLP